MFWWLVQSPDRATRNARRRWRRRMWRALGLLGGTLVLGLALLPFWFPSVLGVALRRLGVEVERVRVVNYGTIGLQAVHWRTSGLELRVRELRLPQPTAWLWHRWSGRGPSTEAWIHLEGWQVRTESSVTNRAPAAGEPPLRLGAMLEQAAGRLAWLRDWLPPLELRDGKVSVGEQVIVVPAGRWQAGRFATAGQVAPLGLNVEAALEFHPDGKLSLVLNERSHQVQMGFDLHRAGADWALLGEGFWRSNRCTLRAGVGRESVGPWPDRLELDLPDVRLTTESVGLRGYSNLRGSVRVTGGGDHYAANGWAAAEPSQPGLPPIRVEMDAHLTPNEVRVVRLECRAPPIQLALLDQVSLRWTTRQLDRPGEFKVDVDLAAQSWVDLRGVVHGSLALTPGPGPGSHPQVAWQLAGENLEAFGFPVQRLDVTGQGAGTTVQRVEFSAGLADGAHARLTARGLELSSQTLAEGTLDLSLPRGMPGFEGRPMTFRSATAAVAFQGALTNLDHRGEATLTGLKLPGLAVADVACHWEGQGDRRVAPEITLTTVGGRLELAGVLETAPFLADPLSGHEAESAGEPDALQTLRAERTRLRTRGASGVRGFIPAFRARFMESVLGLATVSSDHATGEARLTPSQGMVGGTAARQEPRPTGPKFTEGQRRFSLSKLDIHASDTTPLVLQAPVLMQFGLPVSTNGAAAWDFTTSRLVLTNAQRGAALAAAVNWPELVHFELGLTNLDTHFLRPFLESAEAEQVVASRGPQPEGASVLASHRGVSNGMAQPQPRPTDNPQPRSTGAGFTGNGWPTATVEALALRLDCEGGPADWDLSLAGRFEVQTNRLLRVTAGLHGDRSGAGVSELCVRGDEAEEIRLEGRLPVLFGLLGSGRLWELRRTDPLEARFTVAGGRSLERLLNERAGVSCPGLQVAGSASGSLSAPQARVQVSAQAIEPLPKSLWAGRLPRLGRLEVVGRAETNLLALDRLALQVEGVPVTASAQLPVPAGSWEGVLTGGTRVNLTALSARLQTTNLPVGSLAARLAPLLRPEGTLSADVRLGSPGRWDGEVEVQGLGTRPLPLIGPLRDLRARFVLRDQRLQVEKVEADVGGATAQLSGWAGLPPVEFNRVALPPFDLRLTGEQLPLARQAGLVVRGNLDLQLRHEGTNTPALEGTVVLGRSFLLSDLKDIFGNRVRATDRPPPFFRVEAKPVADWRLGVEVKGDEFLHLKSPFYNGVHSVNLKLRGTFKSPLLLGDAQVARGRVAFPYATLPVSQGIVTFTEADPAHPRLQARAAARAFGYDLQMEVGGNLAEPTVQLSSSPPLTSEEILLMVTAGELPRHQLQYTATERLTKLASILGMDLLRKFGAQDAGEERLLLRTGEGISTGGRVTHRLEYRLTDVWSLVGEYDEFDALNAGVKWRILRR